MVKQVKPGGNVEDATAKNIFDRIGRTIQQQVHSASKIYTSELHGDLSQATYPKDVRHTDSTPPNPCELLYQYHTTVTSGYGKEYPCGKGKEERFSDTQGAECDHRIKGNDRNKTGGACAPYRRLHLCDQNLEHINHEKITSTHNLLLEVCLAALHEGQSLETHYPQYEVQYPSSGSVSITCTMFARSFADIGDIVRGRDLYRGNKKENKQREKLEENLKKIFGKIHKEVTSGSNGQALKRRYDGDTTNFFKLREDWWEANRETVWKALTCHAPEHASYFRETCGGGKTPTQGKCRCSDNQVPTYFDYVPQYLRWFEEWAEDFCRKRKKKIENAIKNCRGPSGNDRYCDLNGFDCTQTAKKENKLFPDSNCNKCSVACNPFVPWIVNQKEEFDKQKKKYNEEIKKEHPTTITIKTANGNTTINNLYVKDFYEKLREDYGNVDDFLEKLSKEGICQSAPHVEEETADAANFTNVNTEKTFSRSKYCRACPLCGVTGEKGKWKDIDDGVCANLNKKKNYKEDNITDIPVLTPEKGKTGILKKYETFCATGGGQIEKWQCYYDEIKKSGQNNNCILGKWESFTGEEDVMSYNAFFWKWVSEMLDDSIKWRKELDKCLKNNKKTCGKKKCNRDCKCYKKWVKKKKTEWEEIEKHFRKQKDMENEGLNFEMALKILLNEVFLEDMKHANGDPQHIAKIEELKEKKNDEPEDYSKAKTIIDLLIEEEEQDADECVKNNQEDPCPPKPPEESPLRSDTSPNVLPGATDGRSENHDTPAATVDSESEEQEEEEEEEDEDEDDEDNVDSHQEASEEALPDETEVVEETVAEVTEQVTAQVDNVDVCKTVEEALKDNTALQEACQQKYSEPNRYWGWKCISDTNTTSGDTTSDKGSICVPPRRRRLYIHKVGNGGEDITTTESLRKWFIETAAIETFFLWDRYKKEWMAQKNKAQNELGGAGQPLSPVLGSGSDDNNPQTSLQNGKIPPDFLRLMFYTLGDYRDICVGKTPDGIDEVITSDQKEKDSTTKITVKQISERIQKILKGDNPSPRSVKTPSTSDKTPQQTWWNKHGQHIWNGMICALTYRDSEQKGGGGNPTVDEKVKKVFFGENNTGKPGTYQEKYEYSKVELKDEEENSGTRTNNQPTKLENFVVRPPYFRYLEEWGQNFCKERKKRLEQIKVDCRGGENGNKNCSGDGENCDEIRKQDYSTISNFKCPDCGKHCRFYKMWIDRKKTEYEKQESAYSKQKSNYVNGSNGDGGNNNDKEFYTKLETCTKATNFLESLKGQCIGNNNGGTDIKFSNTNITFGSAEDCKPCSEFKVNCKNGNCGGSPNGNTCNGKNIIDSNDIKGMAKFTDQVDMLVSDDSATGFAGDLKNPCEKASIFEGIREDKWKCGYVCGVDICKPENVNGGTDGKEYIQIRALLKRWVETFLEDYNKIKHKISHCTKKGEKTICIKHCDKKCECVGKWVENKKKEWQEIRERYFKQYTTDHSDIYKVTSFLEDSQFYTEVQKAIKPCSGLTAFEDSIHCNGNASAGKEKDAKKDVVVCLLDKLEKEAEKCQNQNETACDTPSTCDENLTPDVEDEEPLEEENQTPHEAQKMMPKICEGVVQEAEPVVESGCVPAKTKPEEPAATESEQKPRQTPILKPEEEVPQEPAPAAPSSTPTKPQPTTPYLSHPAVIPSLVTSTLAWSVGIGFAAFTYFFLK
ncbi:hypothetical protein PFNF135_06193, partial [Plasmodium falciparum NF135/5.C10]